MKRKALALLSGGLDSTLAVTVFRLCDYFQVLDTLLHDLDGDVEFSCNPDRLRFAA